MLAIKQIKTDGTIINLGRAPCTLEQAQEYVRTGSEHGYIEVAHNSGDGKFTMFCHEEGLLIDLPLNPIASVIANNHIVGDVLIVENEAKDFE